MRWEGREQERWQRSELPVEIITSWDRAELDNVPGVSCSHLPVVVHVNGRVRLHGGDQIPGLLLQAGAVGFRLGQVESLLSQAPCTSPLTG